MFKVLLLAAVTIESGTYTDRSTYYHTNGKTSMDGVAEVRMGKLLVIHSGDMVFVGEKKGPLYVGRWWSPSNATMEARFWIAGRNRLEGEVLLPRPTIITRDLLLYIKITTVLEKR